MKYLIGFLACALLWAFHHDKNAVAVEPVEPETVFIEYQTDFCGADNIGLKRLTLKDVEGLL